MQQTIVWTALPAGFGLWPLVTVFVAPRLVPDGDAARLADFPDWLNWPRTIGDARWTVEFDDGVPREAVRQAGIDPVLWLRLFRPDMPVRPPSGRRYDDHLVHSYPAANLVSFLRDQYGALAARGGADAPAAQQLLDPGSFGGAALVGVDRRTGRSVDVKGARLAEADALMARPDPQSGRPRRAVPVRPPDPDFDLALASRFHAPFAPERLPDVVRPGLSFHEVLALLGDHPELLRRLGLAITLEVARVGPRNVTTGLNTVRAVPTWTSALGPQSVDVRPRTRCVIDRGRFYPVPLDPQTDIVDGLVPLDDPSRFQVLQVDTDQAALTTRDFANALVMRSAFRGGGTPEREPLPALRTAGLSVVRPGRASRLVAALDRGASLLDAGAALDGALLGAEHVTRGVRLRVREQGTGEWRSLHARRQRYETADGTVVAEVEDEGVLSDVPTTRPGVAGALFLSEVVASWSGWSLSAPRPGRAYADDGSLVPADDPGVNPVHPDFPVRVVTEVREGSLPVLRFGRTYQFQGRVVDLAGQTLRERSRLLGGEDRPSPPETFLRWEPVASPGLVLQAPRLPGESIDRVVLRSDVDQAPGGPPADPAVADFAYGATTQRHVVAPQVGELLAELHGALDGPDGRPDPAAYALLAQRANARLDDDPGMQRDPDDHDAAYHPGPDGGLPALTVPYLPDPLARGAVFRGLPGDAGPRFVPFRSSAGPWPRTLPVRLVLEEGDGPARLEGGEDERRLVVPLPKATVAQVQLSCGLEGGDHELLGVWSWLRERLGGDVPAELVQQARTGGHRMLTPPRTLTLVHAVRRPLATAEFEVLRVRRAPGDTFAVLDGSLAFSRRSTGRVDVLTSWEEPVDRGRGEGEDAPSPSAPHGEGDPVRGRHALEVPLREDPDGVDDRLPLEDRHEFGDTKHRRLTCSTVATTAFLEHFTDRRRTTVPGVLDARGVVPGSVRVHALPAGPGAPVSRYEEGRDYRVEGGALTRPEGSRIGPGEQVDATYLVGPVTRTSQESRVVSVPSSARPLPPKVLSVVPTFRWEGGDGVSTRRGGGLRVWLDRPWWSSGEGELLGVVLEPEAAVASTAPFVSRWGADPVVRSRPLTARLDAARFTGSAAARTGVLLPEAAAPVDVVGYAVGFDSDRELWFADLEIDAGTAYQPFVRLALVRYQPESLGGLHLSPVVLADFAQLAPDRTATVVAESRARRRVTLRGVSYRPSPYPPRVTAALEQRPLLAADDPAAWTPFGRGPVEMSAVTQRDGSTEWSCSLVVPTDRRTAYRVVVDEVERHVTTTRGRAAELGERLVHTDAIPL